ncbi:MAG: NAD-dependent deacetylase [Anaerolineae bacterium]
MAKLDPDLVGETPQSRIEQAASLIVGAEYAIALTGAGVSTPSGIPDFRSPGGIWSQVDPVEVGSIWGFRRNPEKFYDFFGRRAGLLRRAEPNSAHLALAELEKMGLLKAIITQNIDRLHQAAGSRQVIELHGNMAEMVCLDRGHLTPSGAVWERYGEDGEVPRCEMCGGLLKPNVILFGEMLPAGAIASAQEEAARSDVFLAVGSSLEVTPAAELPLAAVRGGAQLIVVNLTPTPADDDATLVLRGDVAEVLPQIVETCGRPQGPPLREA